MSTQQGAHAPPPGAYRIPPDSRWAGSWKIVGIVGLLGLGAAGYGYTLDHERFAYSYLFGFFVALSLCLGSLFFVLVQYVTKASWGVTVRRIAEHFMRPMHVFALLAIPLVFMTNLLFPWLGGGQHAAAQAEKDKEHAAEVAAAASAAPKRPEVSPFLEVRGDPAKEPAAMRDLPVRDFKTMDAAEEHEEAKVVDHKRFLLNKPFLLARLVGCLVLWWLVGQYYFRWSTEQDKTKALENTAMAQKFAPLGLVVFAVTLSLFAFDWFLSLDATWFSTMFGVYIFAQVALFQMANLTFWAFLFKRSKLLGDAVNVEHFHDLGKLLFGWIVFWSYIAFAQFFLTWYSNIPDEVAFFHKRWHDNDGTWQNVSLALIALHFFVPFWFLMSRNIKRRLPLLATGAVIMLLMHVVEVYWVVMPNYGPLAPHWMDVACLVGVFCVYLASVLRGMEDYPLVAVGDPRLSRALNFENA